MKNAWKIHKCAPVPGLPYLLFPSSAPKNFKRVTISDTANSIASTSTIEASSAKSKDHAYNLRQKPKPSRKAIDAALWNTITFSSKRECFRREENIKTGYIALLYTRPKLTPFQLPNEPPTTNS